MFAGLLATGSMFADGTEYRGYLSVPDENTANKMTWELFYYYCIKKGDKDKEKETEIQVSPDL